MTSAGLFQDLSRRGLVAQASDLESMQALLDTPQTVYCGFDPTAGSLHIGHLVPLLMLKRFQDAGHFGIALIGGATGMIGDPSFKATERTLNSASTVKQWVNALEAQIIGLMRPHLNIPLKVVDNADWMQSFSVIDFFRKVGKHFSVNSMINRESVRTRLERPEQGMSFTEFSYALLQSYDFAQLNNAFDCRIQIGGNDQWGNIVSGIDLTRRLNGNQVFGLTLPLITKADGTKFGKTESGTVWLDAAQTSPYNFYQFWLNTDDADVYQFLRYYTFLDCDVIEEIEEQDKAATGSPRAQRILAETLTRFVHGEAALSAAQRISESLFSGNVQALTLSELEQLELDGMRCLHVHPEQPLADLLVLSELAKSKRQARELINHGAVRVNGEVSHQQVLGEAFALMDQYWIVQKGKKQFRLFKRS